MRLREAWMAPSHGQGAATCGWPPCPCTACDLCPQGWALAGACDPGLTSGASPRLQEATQMAEQPQSTTRQPPVTLSLLRSSVYPETGPWTVCAPQTQIQRKRSNGGRSCCTVRPGKMTALGASSRRGRRATPHPPRRQGTGPTPSHAVSLLHVGPTALPLGT